MKLRVLTIATVMTLGIGGAVVSSNNSQTPNVQKMAVEGLPTDW